MGDAPPLPRNRLQLVCILLVNFNLDACVDFYKALYNDHFASPGMTAAVPIKIEDSDSDTIKGEDIPWDS